MVCALKRGVGYAVEQGVVCAIEQGVVYAIEQGCGICRRAGWWFIL